MRTALRLPGRSARTPVTLTALTAGLLIHLTPAHAQTPATLDGPALLDWAIQANGGEALRSLRSLSYHSTLTVASEGSVLSTSSADVWQDVPGERALIRSVNVYREVESQLITPDATFFSSPRMGTVPASRQQATAERLTLWTDVPGLRAALLPGTVLKNLGPQIWTLNAQNTVRGLTLEASRSGQPVRFLLDPAGQLVADQYTDEDGDVQTRVYHEPFTEAGVRLHRRVDTFIGGAELDVTETMRNIRVNLPLPATLFTLPGLAELQGALYRPALPFSTITAQDVFDAYLYRYAQSYHGPSTVGAADLRGVYLPLLQQRCGDPTTCAPTELASVLNEMTDGIGDGHTAWLSPAEADAYRARRGNGGEQPYFLGTRLYLLTGLGLTFGSVTPGSAIALAGWQPGDVITGVNGQDLLTGSGRITPDAATAVTGFLNGQTTTFTLSRQGTPRTSTVTLTRLQNGDVHLNLRPDGLAVLTVLSFQADNVAQLIHDAVRQAMQAGARGLILDLRANSGGQRNQGILAAGAFMPPTPRRNETRNETQTVTYDAGQLSLNGAPIAAARVQNPVRYEGPLVVLVDDRSASASEFLARDLLDRPRTAVIGQPTAGVGNTSVRNYALPDQSILALTAARNVDASGAPTPDRIEPAIVAELDFRLLIQTGRDSVIEQAVQILGRL